MKIPSALARTIYLYEDASKPAVGIQGHCIVVYRHEYWVLPIERMRVTPSAVMSGSPVPGICISSVRAVSRTTWIPQDIMLTPTLVFGELLGLHVGNGVPGFDIVREEFGPARTPGLLCMVRSAPDQVVPGERSQRPQTVHFVYRRRGDWPRIVRWSLSECRVLWRGSGRSQSQCGLTPPIGQLHPHRFGFHTVALNCFIELFRRLYPIAECSLTLL